MRVRKSIPEGYKTHKTLGTGGFPFPSSAPTPSTARPRVGVSGSRGKTEELMPFCGLHKTGGLDRQAPPPSSAPAAMQIEEETDDQEDQVPRLSMSQQTLPSTGGSFASFLSPSRQGSTKKRSYDEEIEDDMDALFDELDAAEMHDAGPRRIAKPKRNLRRAVTVGGEVGMLNPDDFDEAEFLAPMDLCDA